MRDAGQCQRSDDRILGDGNFVDKVLTKTKEGFNTKTETEIQRDDYIYPDHLEMTRGHVAYYPDTCHSRSQ